MMRSISLKFVEIRKLFHCQKLPSVRMICGSILPPLGSLWPCIATHAAAPDSHLTSIEASDLECTIALSEIGNMNFLSQ
jgi:hypothetical protein